VVQIEHVRASLEGLTTETLLNLIFMVNRGLNDNISTGYSSGQMNVAIINLVCF